MDERDRLLRNLTNSPDMYNPPAYTRDQVLNAYDEGQDTVLSLVNLYPNDNDLGKAIRKLYWKRHGGL